MDILRSCAEQFVRALRRTSTRFDRPRRLFLRPDVKAPAFSRDKDEREREILYIYIDREKDLKTLSKGRIFLIDREIL